MSVVQNSVDCSYILPTGRGDVMPEQAKVPSVTSVGFEVHSTDAWKRFAVDIVGV